jgi:hypothetical protein
MVSMKLCTESDNFISFHKCHGNIDKTDYNKGLHLHLQRIHIQQRERRISLLKNQRPPGIGGRGAPRGPAPGRPPPPLPSPRTVSFSSPPRDSTTTTMVARRMSVASLPSSTLLTHRSAGYLVVLVLHLRGSFFYFIPVHPTRP